MEAKLLANNTRVQLTGTVLAVPKTLGKQIFYVADNSGGIQVYKHDAVFPELPIGTIISITGVLSTNRGERRIKLSGDNSIRVQGTGSSPEYLSLSIAGIVSDHVGALIQTKGIVIDRNGSTLTLEHESQTIQVKASVGDKDLGRFPRGTMVLVTGIVSRSNETLRVLSRSPNDLEQIQEEILPVSALTGKEQQANKNRSIGVTIALMALSVLSTLGIRQFIQNLKTAYARNNLVRVAAKNAR